MVTLNIRAQPTILLVSFEEERGISNFRGEALPGRWWHYTKRSREGVYGCGMANHEGESARVMRCGGEPTTSTACDSRPDFLFFPPTLSRIRT